MWHVSMDSMHEILVSTALHQTHVKFMKHTLMLAAWSTPSSHTESAFISNEDPPPSSSAPSVLTFL